MDLGDMREQTAAAMARAGEDRGHVAALRREHIAALDALESLLARMQTREGALLDAIDLACALHLSERGWTVTPPRAP